MLDAITPLAAASPPPANNAAGPDGGAAAGFAALVRGYAEANLGAATASPAMTPPPAPPAASRADRSAPAERRAETEPAPERAVEGEPEPTEAAAAAPPPTASGEDAAPVAAPATPAADAGGQRGLSSAERLDIQIAITAGTVAAVTPSISGAVAVAASATDHVGDAAAPTAQPAPSDAAAGDTTAVAAGTLAAGGQDARSGQPGTSGGGAQGGPFAPPGSLPGGPLRGLTVSAAETDAAGGVIAGDVLFAAASGRPADAAAASRGTAPLASAAEQVAEQVKVRLALAARAGADHIAIELTPEHLGRVEVRLDVGRDGRVSAVILAAEPATLDLLKSDARGLEQALANAGLDASDDALSFGLLHQGDANGRDQPANGRAGLPSGQASEAAPPADASSRDAPPAAKPIASSSRRLGHHHVDLHA